MEQDHLAKNRTPSYTTPIEISDTHNVALVWTMQRILVHFLHNSSGWMVVTVACSLFALHISESN